MRTIINKLSEDLSETVMATLVDKYTGYIEGKIQVTMVYLLATSDNISDQYLNGMYQKTNNHNYVNTNPIADILNFIHKYSMMTKSQGISETSQQLV